MKTRNQALADKMRLQGWVRPDEVAARLLVSVSTVRTWAREVATIRTRRIPEDTGALYLAWLDCVRYFGVDNAIDVGALKPEEAADFR